MSVPEGKRSPSFAGAVFARLGESSAPVDRYAKEKKKKRYNWVLPSGTPRPAPRPIAHLPSEAGEAMRCIRCANTRQDRWGS